ncbi:S9 family peptidase [Sphingomonas sabuli]|uniref:S9 family peptidase n=1 Tax=Sphingomonas sabuli TaxID=2764186 RepID=A0A7G9L5F7_9SPHN|nr:S9 family peptidase [Sphingomonas sabuli]QNM83856.1 S9 family peptidase [Sphingomonas sabuli]
MSRLVLLVSAAAIAVPSIAIAQAAPVPPVAETVPYTVKGPKDRNDPYYWLRDDSRKNPKMLAYLKAENAYADAMLADTKPLQDRLYQEIIGRIKQDDSSVPFRERGYFYYTRFETGADYPILARKRGNLSAPEEILLDQPAMAKGHGFFSVGEWVVSPNNQLLAYAEDVVGRRQYVLKFKDLATGRTLTDTVQNVEPNFVWADDNRTVYYVEKDPTTLLSKRVKAHVLGTPASADTLVYEEKDDSFYMGVGRTSDDKYLCIGVQSTVSDEQRCTSAAAPGQFAVIAPREREFRYSADHIGDRWIIRTNRNAPNYKLVTVPDAQAASGRDAWADLVAHDPNVFIEGFKPFNRFIAIEQRSNGNKNVRLLKGDGSSSAVASDEPAYSMDISSNYETDTTKLRYTYDSLTTPRIYYEVDALTGARTVLKRTPAPNYDPSLYATERVWATARDGTRVPVSLVYRKGYQRDGTAPMLQYGYGSYGASMDPAWSPTITPLLDRGLVYAIAHIRGGQEMGRAWYDQGHLLNKKNSFTDFIDVTRFLVANKYAAPNRVAAMGGSAGGLLMGGIANMAPQDYRVFINQVPFVDVVTTMLDASIPLTTNEYDEWGNPADPKFYDYMLSYSPYDNLRRQAYPAMFVGTGLWDSQVQYYEPTKYVAKLRTLKTDTNPLVYRVNMEAGHGGKSGRFEQYRSRAEYYAFMLDQLGVAEPVAMPPPAPAGTPGERGR